MLACPLCGDAGNTVFHSDRTREYRLCGTCAFVFVPAAFHLPWLEERAYYDLHENHVDDPGYRKFLGRLFSPMQRRLAASSRGLDFGCGEAPALAVLFREAGHTVALYDPHYAPDDTVLSKTFDFIVLSEVAEHLSAPGLEFDRLWDCLEPGGWIGVMTKRVRDRVAFRTWHYVTDPTHIGFFSETSFQYLAARWRWQGAVVELVIEGPDVVLIGKSA
jgi:SAM-dependent methyltransferase